MNRVSEILALNTEEEMRAWVRDLTVPELYDVLLDISKIFKCYAIMIDIVGLMVELPQTAAGAAYPMHAE